IPSSWLSISGLTMSTQERQTRCSARSSSDLMASGEPDAMANLTACGLDPLPATALPAAASEMPRNVTTASFIVLFVCMSVSPLRQVFAEVELAAHVDVQREQVHLVGRELREALVGRVADRPVGRRAIREGANRRVHRREALVGVQHLDDQA